MRSNIDIDDKLLQQVMQSGGFSSKEAAVEGNLDDIRTSKYAAVKSKRIIA